MGQGAAGERRWFWVTLMLSSVSIAAVVFAVWELLEYRFFAHLDYLTLHYMYVTRGMACSLLLAVWAAWYVLRVRRHSEEELRRSHERYRGLLEVSPGAVVLYDASLQVSEWNAAAQKLYGFTKTEVLGRQLPTVPPEKEAELREFVEQVRAGRPVTDVETVRVDRGGAKLDVELSLLPFRDASGEQYFLEVAADIRERVRLQRRLLEIEKLTSMGQMAAGTAHHLNTPLAAMLLRVQMMRERPPGQTSAADLERLEEGMRFCQHFVQRLLDFSRQAPAAHQPEDLARIIESVVSFLAPSVLARRARVLLDVSEAAGRLVVADRNHLEALFSILLSNALDAIAPQGTIRIHGRRIPPDCIEVAIADDGCGIAPELLPRVFAPFFTTKAAGRGTGLGLAIARNIVQEHGGSIRLESAPGRGTSLFVTLPLCRPDRVPAPQDEPAAAGRPVWSAGLQAGRWENSQSEDRHAKAMEARGGGR